jgi:hypothetical protein
MMRLDGGAGRWIYLPYAVVLTVELILSVGEAPLAMVWYYWVPIPFFVIQFVWPTVIGWAAATAAWFLCSFVSFLYARVCVGIGDFSNWFLVLYGLAPLIPLVVFRPRIGKSR